MKFAIALLALASLAIAGPPEKEWKEPKEPKEPKGRECKPGTYRCLPYGNGWEVCDHQGRFVTVCKFYPPSMSPYCVPPKYEFP
ncbi:hypothetical protein ESCO_004373 [Escovopsis weberi]|uniref:Uncharacterized protein n=1 Tax=Escovopsis weberi TaxID=150374 RepID=A0A0M8N690_ESCWE|nr:hypothetical protein ESCO_004373 [Escovopsis weberi]